MSGNAAKTFRKCWGSKRYLREAMQVRRRFVLHLVAGALRSSRPSPPCARGWRKFGRRGPSHGGPVRRGRPRGHDWPCHGGGP
jgi:hypothetical protein